MEITTLTSRRRMFRLLAGAALGGGALVARTDAARADTTYPGPVKIQGTLSATDLITAKNGVQASAGAIQMATYPKVPGMSVPIAFPSDKAPWRWFLTSISDLSGVTDNQLVLGYNATKSNKTGAWIRDVATEPTTVLAYESLYNGNAEWNWDVSGRRPWGSQYTYGSGDCAFAIGTVPEAPGSGGIRVNGGPVFGQLWVRSAAGQAASSPIMRLSRGNGTTFFMAHPQAAAWVLTGSTSADVNGTGWNGLMHIVSTPQAFSVGGTSSGDIVIQTQIDVVGGSNNNSRPRFVLNTDGMQRWGSGATSSDVGLYRAGVQALKATGNAAVSQLLSNLSGGGRISQGSGAPGKLALGVPPAPGDLFFRTDTPTVVGQRIYVCTVGGIVPSWVGIV